MLHQLRVKHVVVAATTVVSVGLLIPLLTSQTAIAQYPKTMRHKGLMEQKLGAANKVMEGIARANFDTVAKQSQKLHLLSREAGWNVLATPTYLRLSEDFRATAEQLESAAEKKNLDAVGLAYVKLSISCIECHRYARKEMPKIGFNIDPKPRTLNPPTTAHQASDGSATRKKLSSIGEPARPGTRYTTTGVTKCSTNLLPQM